MRARPADPAQTSLAGAVTLLVVAALIATTVAVVVQPSGQAARSGPQTFGSRDELAAFLEEHDADGRHHAHIDRATCRNCSAVAMDSAGAPASGASDASAEASDHSSTNVQVAGVDEADIVKNDGRYIYAVTGDRVVAVQAYPPSQAQRLGDVPLPDGQPKALFLDGDRLVVIGGSADGPEPVDGEEVVVGETEARRPGPHLPATYVRVYDVADPADPALQRDTVVHGRYDDARMIDGHAYVVLDVPLRFDDNDEPVVPVVHPDQDGFPEIHHFDEDDDRYGFTNVVSVPVQDDREPVLNEAFLLGQATDLYASRTNLYLASPQDVGGYGPRAGRTGDRTAIHKIALDDGRVTYEATGEVRGRILNQFSMDEHDGHLRVATTVGHVSRRSDGQASSSNVFVLDESMRLVGRREGIAPGERIYSARFMGDRAYLVTFKKVDPFFVLDLSDPTDPTILGELKLPGYSDYLHPIGDDHVVGIGKQTVAAESGDFAWYQGVKVAVFDASDVHDPKVRDDLVIGDRGTESPVLDDHKALLHDPQREVMSLQILQAEILESDYEGDEPSPNTHGDPVWQGAYVLDVSADGVSVRGTVSHVQGEFDRYEDRGAFIHRSVRMENVLYTVSDRRIKANRLSDLAQLAQVEMDPVEVP